MANSSFEAPKTLSLLLDVRDLSVAFRRQSGYETVVKSVSFSLSRGKTLGIVGESGSGKSVSSLALMHLLDMPPARIESGSAWLSVDGASPVDLLALSDDEMQNYRGNRIAMIFQEPMTSLNPLHTCGRQVVEMLQRHCKVSDDEARKRVISLFEEVQLPRPQKIFDSYPHEISGGQKQRVMIAMALICHPDILIADEPTTALDVMVQQAILQLLRKLQMTYNIAIIFISHDLGVIAQVADDIAVMYRGSLVECGKAVDILHNPSHPYTRGLLACRPPIDCRPRRLPTVGDYMTEQPAGADTLYASSPAPAKPPSNQPVLQVRDLSVVYTLQRSFWGKPKQQLKAVDGVSFDLYAGETVALVGGSGCGKTTLGRALLRLVDTVSGSVSYKGVPLNTMSANDLRRLRSKIQIIFQDPYSSLNPRITVGDAICEPLRVHNFLDNDVQRREYVVSLLQQVGLDANAFGRYPHQFSGGQRQRVCIARALALHPDVVVCDESVSALDVSVQAQVLNLLSDLKDKYGYTYLFITHDLSVVHFIASRVLVMQQGRIVEQADTDTLFASPQHQYTQQLISAIPSIQ